MWRIALGYTDWAKAFVDDHSTTLLRKIFYFLKGKAMYLAKTLSPGGSYNRQLDLSGQFLVCWLCSYVFAISFTTIHPETFLMVVHMAKGKRYSLFAPDLALLHKVMGEFCVVHGEVKRTYRPWTLVIGWLGVYFSQGWFSRVNCNDLFRVFLVCGPGLYPTLST